MIIVFFLSLLALCFAIVMGATRQATLNKSLKRRLEELRDSSKNEVTGAPLLDLTEVEQPGLVVRLGELLGRYGFAKKLSLLIMHADSTATVGSVLLTCLCTGC